MPTLIDELAAAATVSQALASGRDVRELSAAEYARVRAEMIASIEAARVKDGEVAEMARLTQRYAKGCPAVGKNPTQ